MSGIQSRTIQAAIAGRVKNSTSRRKLGLPSSAPTVEFAVGRVAGWPLAKPLRHGRIEMTNLIGAEVEDYARWLTVPGASVHLYGKGAPRPGRKMGHLNLMAATAEEVRANALRAAAILGIEAF